LFAFTIPPLRERREDVRLLVNYFLKKFARDQQTQPKSVSTSVIKNPGALSLAGQRARNWRTWFAAPLVVSKGDAILLSELPPEIASQAQLLLLAL